MTGLNLDNDSAFLRGIEMADDATVEEMIRSIREMRQPTRYSNQDVDRRMSARAAMSELRKVGNIPLKRTA